MCVWYCCCVCKEISCKEKHIECRIRLIIRTLVVCVLNVCGVSVWMGEFTQQREARNQIFVFCYNFFFVFSKSITTFTIALHRSGFFILLSRVCLKEIFVEINREASAWSFCVVHGMEQSAMCMHKSRNWTPQNRKLHPLLRCVGPIKDIIASLRMKFSSRKHLSLNRKVDHTQVHIHISQHWQQPDEQRQSALNATRGPECLCVSFAGNATN